MRTRLRQIPALARARCSEHATAAVASSGAWKQADEVLLFLSMSQEIDTAPLMERAITCRKAVFLPRVTTDGLVFHRYHRTDQLATHRFGMREPLPDAPRWEPTHPETLLICPGLAFDPCGRRLGQGGGYYDRFLTEHEEHLTSMGLCYRCQLLDAVPAEPTDRAVQFVATEEGMLESGRQYR